LTAIDLSGDIGLFALALLTLNILLGLLISVRYSPWRYWPHRRVNIFWIHNQTGLAALAVSILHPLILLFSSTAGFHWLDVVFPAWAPQQPVINLFGAAAIYTLAFVLITSHYRVEIGRRTWKKLHFTTYLLAAFVFIHSLLTDPKLNGSPIDLLDGEKVLVEACLIIILIAALLRLRHAQQKRRRLSLAPETVPEPTP
jgi:predicted ferric reductase